MSEKTIPQIVKDCLEIIAGKIKIKEEEREALEQRVENKMTLLLEAIKTIKEKEEIGQKIEWIEIRVSGLGAIIIQPLSIKVLSFEIQGSGTIISQQSYTEETIKEKITDEQSTASRVLSKALEKSAKVSFLVP
jgi:hypothetical protein